MHIHSCKSSYSNHLPICPKETLAFRAQKGANKAQVITFKRHALSYVLALFQCSNRVKRKMKIRTPHARGFNQVNQDACIERERERERFNTWLFELFFPTVTSCDTKMSWIGLNDMIVNVNGLRNVETGWDSLRWVWGNLEIKQFRTHMYSSAPHRPLPAKTWLGPAR